MWIVTLWCWGTLLIRAETEEAVRALAAAWIEPHRQRTGADFRTPEAMIERIERTPAEWTLCLIGHYHEEVSGFTFE